MGIETALAIGLAAAGTATSVVQAQQQNAATKKAKASAEQAATVKAQQVQRASDLERLKAIRRSAQIRGRLQLAGAEAGLGDYNSLEALSEQNDLNTGLNLSVIEQNRMSELGSIDSQMRDTVARLNAGTRNTLLSGFEGTLRGAQQGLEIGRGIAQADRVNPTGPVGDESDFFS